MPSRKKTTDVGMGDAQQPGTTEGIEHPEKNKDTGAICPKCKEREEKKKKKRKRPTKDPAEYKPNPWRLHLKQFAHDHPELKWKEVMIQGKATYKKPTPEPLADKP